MLVSRPQAAMKSIYNHKGKGALSAMAGNNESEPLTGLLQGIETLKDEVNQLCSEAKNHNP